MGISSTKITYAGVLLIPVTLQSLDLGKTAVTDASVDHLLKMKNLKLLGVEKTNISPQGLQRLREGLPRCEVRTGAAISEAP